MDIEKVEESLGVDKLEASLLKSKKDLDAFISFQKQIAGLVRSLPSKRRPSLSIHA